MNYFTSYHFSYLIRCNILVKEHIRNVHKINLCDCKSKYIKLNGIKENFSCNLFSDRDVRNSRLHCDNLICESKAKVNCFLVASSGRLSAFLFYVNFTIRLLLNVS
jgi:hypothetical protein